MKERSTLYSATETCACQKCIKHQQDPELCQPCGLYPIVPKFDKNRPLNNASDPIEEQAALKKQENKIKVKKQQSEPLIA